MPTTYEFTHVTLSSVQVDTDEKGQLRELHFTRMTITAGGNSKC